MIEREYEIKAKKTVYGGVTFRSREEARWAVFFDSLGIVYEYEPFWDEVGPDYLTVNYLPDFYLKKQDIFIEVKPAHPTDIEKRKAAYWCKDVQEIVILFNLNPPTEKNDNGWLFYYPNISKIPIIMKNYWWGECSKCGHIDIAEFAYVTSCGCFSPDYYNDLYEKEEVDEKNYSKSFSRSKRLLSAYSIAKNHKFHLGNNEKVKMVRYQKSLF